MGSLTLSMTNLSTELAHLGLESEVPDIPAAQMLIRPLDIFRSHLATLVASALSCDLELAYSSIGLSSDPSRGDLEIILPKLKVKDVDLADLIPKLQTPLFATPYADGPRIRFLFSNEMLPRLLLPYILDRKATYGQYSLEQQDEGLGNKASSRKVVVDFSSPNVGKAFDGRHLRSTLIGAFVANIYSSMGWDVVRINYLGDWGKDLALLAIGFQRFGNENKLQADPLGHMLEVSAQIRGVIQPELDNLKQAKSEGNSTADIEATGVLVERDTFFKKLECDDEASMTLWKRFRDLTVHSLAASYTELGIHFDEFSGESQINKQTYVEIETALKEKGVLEEADGESVVDFETHSGHEGKGMGSHKLWNRDRSTTYLLRDVAAAIDRDRTYEFDKMLYVVSFRQDTHFKLVKLTLKLIDRDDLATKLHHVSFGEINGITNEDKMPLTLNSIIDGIGASMECGRASVEAVLSTSTGRFQPAAAALSGLLSQESSSKKRVQSYTINSKAMGSVQEESGLKVPFIYTKLSCHISKLSGIDGIDTAEPEFSNIMDGTTVELMGAMARYPEVTEAAFKSLEPHTVFAYLTSLAELLTEYFDDNTPDKSSNTDRDTDEGPAPSLDEEKYGSAVGDDLATSRARLDIFRCARQVMGNGLNLLGFPVAQISV